MIYRHSSVEMPEVACNSVALVLTSPPYPMIKKWNACFAKQGAYEYKAQMDILFKVWNECWNKLIEGGILCINIGDATARDLKTNEFCCYPNIALTTAHCWNLGFTPLVPIYWRKISNRPTAFLGSGFLPVNAYVAQDCEHILIFRRGHKRVFVGDAAERRKQSQFTKQERDTWFQQIWNIQGARGAKAHSGWPEEIPKRLIKMFSIIGDTILDPFCGRGDEKLVESLGRKYIGYEIEGGSR